MYNAASLYQLLAQRREQVRAVLAFSLGPVLGLASGPILARVLAPEGRGQFAAIMQPITVAGAIASFGVPAAATYYAAQGAEPAHLYKRSIYCTALPAIVVLGGMLSYSREVASAQGLPWEIVLLIWTSVIPLALIQVRRGVWQGLSNWPLLDLERGLTAVGRFAGVLLLALLGAHFAGWYAAASMGLFILTSCVLWKQFPTREKQRVPKTGSLISYSAAVSLGTISLFASGRLDQLIFPVAGSNVQLGYYAVAVTVAEVPIVLGTLAARNALTVASAGASLSDVARSIKSYMVLCIASCLVLALAAPLVVPIAFGHDFAPSVMSTIILCIGTVFTSINLVLNSYLSGAGRPLLASLVPVIAVLLTVAAFAAEWGGVTSIYASVTATGSQACGMVAGIIACSVVKRSATGNGKFADRHSSSKELS